MIAIVDYDAGNIMSVQKACAYLGYQTILTRDRAEILQADHVILPGVGAFADAMEKLVDFGLDETLRETVKRGIPLLGICLGLQLLFDRGISFHFQEKAGCIREFRKGRRFTLSILIT